MFLFGHWILWKLHGAFYTFWHQLTLNSASGQNNWRKITRLWQSGDKPLFNCGGKIPQITHWRKSTIRRISGWFLSERTKFMLPCFPTKRRLLWDVLACYKPILCWGGCSAWYVRPQQDPLNSRSRRGGARIWTIPHFGLNGPSNKSPKREVSRCVSTRSTNWHQGQKSLLHPPSINDQFRCFCWPITDNRLRSEFLHRCWVLCRIRRSRVCFKAQQKLHNQWDCGSFLNQEKIESFEQVISGICSQLDEPSVSSEIPSPKIDRNWLFVSASAQNCTEKSTARKYANTRIKEVHCLRLFEQWEKH